MRLAECRGRKTSARTASRLQSKRGPLHSGVTLIELLLVVAIALIAAGIAVPLFARSFQGSQLRAAARHVVMTAKYSRSMAVLRQQYMAILFDKVAGSIEVVSIADRRALAARNRFLAERAAPEGSDEASAAPAIRSELRRPLPADVKIVSFNTRAANRGLEDIYWVNYFPNGMSEGFEIELQDKAGKRARVRVDGLSGDATVAFDS
jgi:prepilin-type N-terminal cleavage/methylation domain-containing protein